MHAVSNYGKYAANRASCESFHFSILQLKYLLWLDFWHCSTEYGVSKYMVKVAAITVSAHCDSDMVRYDLLYEREWTVMQTV